MGPSLAHLVAVLVLHGLLVLHQHVAELLLPPPRRLRPVLLPVPALARLHGRAPPRQTGEVHGEACAPLVRVALPEHVAQQLHARLLAARANPSVQRNREGDIGFDAERSRSVKRTGLQRLEHPQVSSGPAELDLQRLMGRLGAIAWRGARPLLIHPFVERRFGVWQGLGHE